MFRLLLTYFTGSTAARWFSLGGLIYLAISVVVVTSLPQSEHMLAFSFTGIVGLFLGSAMMPLTLGRLAQSHVASILPYARIKLLASAILTVLIVALPCGLLTPLAYVAGVSGDVSWLARDPKLREYTLQLAFLTYTSCCLIAAWLYLAMWFLTSQRNLAGSAKALLVVVLMLNAPVREISELSGRTVWNLQQMVVFAAVFGALFLSWNRIRQVWWRARLPGIFGKSHDVSGREVDFVLGNGQPWVLLATIAAPLAVISWLDVEMNSVWLFYFTIASTVAGATAGQAPARSRALWLRGEWSRAQLFTIVERSCWRHNGFMAGALLVALLGIGTLTKMPWALLAYGVPLLVLGTVLSTYLGLLLTRGISWIECALAAAAMLTLMTVSLVLGAEDLDHPAVLTLLGALAASAVGLRQWARRRWGDIDWSQCRGRRVARAA